MDLELRTMDLELQTMDLVLKTMDCGFWPVPFFGIPFYFGRPEKCFIYVRIGGAGIGLKPVHRFKHNPGLILGECW